MSCTGKILLVFGSLLILVISFVPYRSVHVKFKLDSHSLTHFKMTTQKSGYMFVFKFLGLRSKERPVQQKSVPRSSVSGTDFDYYSLNKAVFLIEMAIILMLAPTDYFLFCIIFKKKKL
jgi:hypothetical protein